tara:strand:- start:6140 stop:8446 length:2307 start_codon:yes stop_codon:yes gene_type:complete
LSALRSHPLQLRLTDEVDLFGEPTAPPPRPAPEGRLLDVAINRPLRRSYTYVAPPDVADSLELGSRVAIQFAGKREVAVIVGFPDATDVPGHKLRMISAVLDVEPVIDAKLLDLTRWMAGYYCCSWGEALAAVLPAALKREGGRRKVTVLSPVPGVGREQLEILEAKHEAQHRLLRTLLDASGPIEQPDLLRRLNLSSSPVKTLLKKGWIRSVQVELETDDLLSASTGDRPKPETLTDDQDHCVKAITKTVEAREYRTFLLRGVTGSGKTEVYLQVIERALAMGRGAIILVPEISLTPQTVGWFRSRFDSVAVLHSRMTDSQRLDMWKRVRRGEARVVVGARSAIFAPMPDLGVVVVDEEHEPSFKQGSTPRYHARDVAVLRARDADAVCILGSATPSLESWENAKQGRYELLELKTRVAERKMPTVEVVDMRLQKGDGTFSRPLIYRLKETLARKEQAILFLNRRGYAPTLWCKACSEVVRCGQCDSAIVFHRRTGRAVCHSCCEERVPPKDCPSCTAPGLKYLGQGSEKVEDLLPKLLPDVRVKRMDSDTMLRREDYETTLDAFGRGEIDVLVGTQMIAKGLDFPRVTLVGVIAADSSLHLPDFRAGERTFQLLCQVAGRAGRADLEGRIVIQTHTPDHIAIQKAATHDYESFVEAELAPRKELGYPPFGRLIRVLIEDEDEQRAKQAAAALGELLMQELLPHRIIPLGPAPAPMALVRGRHRIHFLLKAPLEGKGLGLARELLQRFATNHPRPRITIDVDPVSML